ncbi:Crp/Fnr family transcriptional regulator [Arenibacterium sp. CAU 1754]
MNTLSWKGNSVHGGIRSVPPAVGARLKQDLRSAFGDRLQHFESGRQILLEGEKSGLVFYVTEGWLALSKSLQNGQTQIIDFAIPGDIVDPASADGTTSAITVEALTAGAALVMPSEKWERSVQGNSDLHKTLHKSDAAREARRAERMLRLGKGTAEMRVAYALIEFCIRLGSGRDTDQPTFHIPIVQQQLGDFVGLSSVHVCRTMRRMTRNNILEITDHMDIKILDPQGLAEIAGVDLESLRAEILPKVV